MSSICISAPQPVSVLFLGLGAANSEVAHAKPFQTKKKY